MTKIRLVVVLSFMIALFQSCNNDKVSAPPQPSFTVDATSGQANTSTFTFTINQVNADVISLYPYGTADPTKGGIVIPSADFVNGKAVYTFQYAFTGTFNAVVVANNHSLNGNSVKNVTSAPVTITITSSLSDMSSFSFVHYNKTQTKILGTIGKVTLDDSAKTISVVVPYGISADTVTDVTKLIAQFTVSPFTTVTVGGTAQVSGTTVNNFSSPVQYTVKANDGTTTVYTVTVTRTAVETDNTLKSVSGTEASKSSNNKVIPAAIDNTNNTIVLYDTMGTPSSAFDSVQFNYATNGSFAIAKYNSKVLAQGTQLDLTSSKQVTVYAQDSTTRTFTVYSAAAPKLTLSFDGLIPMVAANTTNFTIKADVLNGTNLSSLATTANWMAASGVTVTSVTANGNPFVSGDLVDYTKSGGAVFVLTVNDPVAGTYQVTYTATVNVVK